MPCPSAGTAEPQPAARQVRGLSAAASRVGPEDALTSWSPRDVRSLALLAWPGCAGAPRWSRPPRPGPHPSGGTPGAPSALVRPGRLVRRAFLTLSSRAWPLQSLGRGPSLPPQPPSSPLSEFQLWSRAHRASTICPSSSECVESLLDSLQPTPLPAMLSADLTAGGTLLIWEASPLKGPCLLGTALEPGPPLAPGSSMCRSQRHAQFYGAARGQTDLWIQYKPAQNPGRVCVTLLWMWGHVAGSGPQRPSLGRGSERECSAGSVAGGRCPEN